jgi:hypothetical protein
MLKRWSLEFGRGGQAELCIRHSFAHVEFLNNCLAFQAEPSDPCDDREERGTQGDSK